MAAHTTNINIENFHVNLLKLEQKVIQFGGIHDGKIPDIAKDVSCIRKYVDEQESSAKEASKAQLISGLGNVVVTSINSVEDIISGDPIKVMKGSLSIAISVAAVVGGPYGAAAAAICSVLGAVISASSPKEPALAAKFAEIVRVELQKFHQKLQDEKFAGLQHRVKTMNNALDRLRKQDSAEIDGGSHIGNLIDVQLYETDLPQFIGEVANTISKGLSRDSPKNDAEDCVRAMVVYCNAQATLLLLLANIMAKLKSTGCKTAALENLFETEKQNSRAVLGFLSEEKYLTASGYLPTEGGKLYMIVALRGNIPAYQVVEEYRKQMGLSKMPDFNVVIEKATLAGFYSVKSIIGLYPAPHKKGDRHYFQLINHTDLPVKIECGTAGDHINGLKFCTNVMPRSSYEHVATGKTFPYWNFSVAGYFIIYLDGEMKDYENRFNGNIKVYEFAVSNPFVGSRKAALLEKTSNAFSTNGRECWDKLNSPYFGDPVFFIHAKKNYVLKASLGGIRNIFKDEKEDNDQGKNGCYTWRYVLQEFDPYNDMSEACIIL